MVTAATSLALASIPTNTYVATAFLPPKVSNNTPHLRLVRRNVVTVPSDSLLLESLRSVQRDKMEKLFYASPDEVEQELDTQFVKQHNDADDVGPDRNMFLIKARDRRRVSFQNHPIDPNRPTISRSSTMPGFLKTSDQKKLIRNRTMTNERAHRKNLGGTMYKNNPSVPDSLVHFADQIHQVDRITRKEEIELGEKTQEAIRLQNLYDVLAQKLSREPTDEEWCAAAGKINMEAVRQTIEEGVEAKNKLVTSNLRMVQSVVNTYLRNGLSTKYNAGDLMQEGIMALIRAAEKFEPNRGWKFSTYAMYWVRSSVKRSQILQSRVILVPQRLHENYKRLQRVEGEMIAKTGRKPSYQEVGESVGMSEKQVERCLKAMEQRCFSLDQAVSNTLKPASDGSPSTLVEIVGSNFVDSDSQQNDRVMLREDLIESLKRHLTSEEVDLLLLRYGLKEVPFENRKTLNSEEQVSIAELSRIFGIKPDKVRRMINRSLKQLEVAGLDEWLAYQRELQ